MEGNPYVRHRWVRIGLFLAASACAGAAEAPPPDDLRAGLAARYASFEQVEMLVGVIRFERDRDRQNEQIVWRPNGVESAWYRRQRGETWVQTLEASGLPRPGLTPTILRRYFIHETAEQCERSSIHLMRLAGEQKIQTQTTIEPPGNRGSWMPGLLGWRTSGVGTIERLLDEPDVRIEREQVDGIDCVVARAERGTAYVAPDYGYAPLRIDLVSQRPDGTTGLSATRWLGYAPGGPAGLWLPTGTVHLAAAKEQGADAGEPFVVDAITVRHILSCQTENLSEPPQGAGVVPVLLGGYFSNRITGLPEEPTTFGYSVDRLFQIAYQELAPFGFEIPELLALPRAPMPGEARPEAAP